MRTIFLYMAIPAFLTMSAERANAKKFELGPVQADLRLNLDLQAASIDGQDETSTLETNVDWAVRLKLEYETLPKIRLGTVVKLDQDFESGSEFSMGGDGINRRLSYLYAKGDWGQISVGNKSGQADLLSLHAPQVGVGQIRGDFSRYNFRPALLNVYDTQNALKIDYVSPKTKPITIGVSYAPEIRDRRDNTLRQTDAVELAVQSQTKIGGQWKVAASAAYVTGQSADSRREDIHSWGLGGELKYTKKWALSGAYVHRGDSDTRAGFDQEEFNLGLAYRSKKWRAGLSGAMQNEDVASRKILGLGGEYKISRNARLRLSGTLHSEQIHDGSSKGAALITDLRLHY